MGRRTAGAELVCQSHVTPRRTWRVTWGKAGDMAWAATLSSSGFMVAGSATAGHGSGGGARGVRRQARRGMSPNGELGVPTRMGCGFGVGIRLVAE